MGRPRKKPTITPRPLAEGRFSYLVTGTVGGKQMRKVCPDMESAKAVAAKWRGADLASLNYFPTRLAIQELRASEGWIDLCQSLGVAPDKAKEWFAEHFKIPENVLKASSAWGQTCSSLGITCEEANLWLAKNYKKPGGEGWVDVIEQFRQSRRTKHRLKPMDPDTPHIGNLVAAVTDFAAHVGRPEIGTPTLDEVEAWLKTRGGKRQLLGDFRSFCIWCNKRGKMPCDPTAAIEREVKERGKLPTVLRPEEVASHLAILEVEAPEWIPYYIICLFSFVRPDRRDGEAQRLDAELRAGETVVHKGGIFVRVGKNGGPRMVPWKFTGPLRGWLLAYPAEGRLFPKDVDSPAKAERAWKPWRKRFGLAQDVLRHTGISAAFYSGANQNELNMAADNSPRMQKDHYIGCWCPEDTEQLWAIKPKYSATAQRPLDLSVSVITSA